MRVTIYDKNPGKGFQQWCLKLSWAIGCWFQKLVGAVDAYKGVSSWTEAEAWLQAQLEPLKTIQVWGHGSPGIVWIAGEGRGASQLTFMKPCVASDSLVWFRSCSVFQGASGHKFASGLSTALGCTIGAHTRTIGILQSGLHTIKPGAQPSWPLDEKDTGPAWLAGMGIQFGGNTIFCLATKIPAGW